jgi:hypothetical protein
MISGHPAGGRGQTAASPCWSNETCTPDVRPVASGHRVAGGQGRGAGAARRRGRLSRPGRAEEQGAWGAGSRVPAGPDRPAAAGGGAASVAALDPAQLGRRPAVLVADPGGPGRQPARPVRPLGLVGRRHALPDAQRADRRGAAAVLATGHRARAGHHRCRLRRPVRSAVGAGGVLRLHPLRGRAQQRLPGHPRRPVRRHGRLGGRRNTARPTSPVSRARSHPAGRASSAARPSRTARSPGRR